MKLNHPSNTFTLLLRFCQWNIDNNFWQCDIAVKYCQ